VLLRRERIVRHFDAMLGEALMQVMKDDGMQIVTHAVPKALERDAAGALQLHVKDGRVFRPVRTA